MGRSTSGVLTGMRVRLHERNKEIGTLLAMARQQRGLTITACAEYIATTPRRYRAIERGDAPVQAAELEALLEVFHLSGNSPHMVWLVANETHQEDVRSSQPIPISPPAGETTM